MSQSTPRMAVPTVITQKLQVVRKRKALMQIATALAAALAVLLAAMGLAMLVDWLATLYDSPWRMALTIAALAAAGATAIGWVVLARRTLGLERVAADVDRQLPESNERWTTVAGVGRMPADPGRTHPAMYRRVATEAVGLAPRVVPEAVVDMSPMLRTLLVLTGVTLALAIAVVLDAQQTMVLVKRFWSPRSLASATEVSTTPGAIVVARGEPLALEAEVTGREVDEAQLSLRSTIGEEQHVTLLGRGESPVKFAHYVRAVRDPFSYRVRAGDGQTPWNQVEVADRPQIEAVRLVVTPPAYTRRPAAEFGELPRQVSAMSGSRVELAILPKAPLKSLVLQLSGDRSMEMPKGADRWHRWSVELNDGFTLSPLLTESHGLTNRQAPSCEFTVYQDKPPAVNVLTPDDELAVQPGDTIEITFSATDDVGISEAELIVYDESGPGAESVLLAAIPIDLGEQAGAAAVKQTVELNLSQFAAQDGVSLSYEIRVREDRGGKAPLAKPSAMAATPAKPGEATPSAADGDAKKEAAPATAVASAAPSEAPAISRDETAEPTPSSSVATSSAPREGGAEAGNDAAKMTPQDATSASQADSTAQAEGKPTKPAPAKSDSIAAAEEASAPATSTAEEAKTAIAAAAATANPPSPPGSETLANSPPPAANQSANAAAAGSSQQPSKGSPASESPRTAASGRQSLSSSEKPEESEAPTEGAAAMMAGDEKPATKSNTNPAANPQVAAAASSASSPASPSDQPSSPSDPPPGDSMSRRSLDVPQSGASQRMRLTVDQWAGSFAGQQRAKLELAISPKLEALDGALAKSQRTARGVLDAIEPADEWRDSHQREVAAAEQFVVEAQEIVAKLQQQSEGTPYAFVGLQVADVGLAHIDPAKADFWKSLQSAGADRTSRLRDAWQHVGRARELIAELRGQYERAKREFQLAESIERVKKMYQVYIEDSQTLLQTQDGDPNRFNRKMAEFDLDDDYLKRLQEVMEMRRDLRAELARILAQDPRLLRRFMDSLRNRTNNLREDLAELTAAQEKLNGEVRAWANAADETRPRVAQLLMLRHLAGAKRLETAAAEFQSRYQTWLSLAREAEDPNLAAASNMVQAAATAASELNASTAEFAAALQGAPAATGESTGADSAAIGAAGDSANVAETPATVDAYALMERDGKAFYELLARLEVALRQLAAHEDGGETAAFAANRLVETRRLIADASAWVRQSQAHQAGQYAVAAEIDQYRLAMQTDELAGKLGSIEQTLAALMQREDGTLPAPIAEKAREFIAMLDKRATPNQTAAVYSLRTDQLPRAVERQALAGAALAQAEKLYDEMIRLAIEELDKLPVQDPIADLLDDPTLDELLAQLEQEAPLEELLGIPQRPSNLRVVGDWLSGGGDNAIATGGGAGAGQTLMNQVKQDEQDARRQMDKAQRRAIARARQTAARRKIDVPATAKLSDWNQLVSRLGDDLSQGRDKAPPEQYRRAIEQYFAEIARAAAVKSGSPP